MRFKYSLECTNNIDDLESWAIYKDFTNVCRTGSIDDIRRFHDYYLVDYEACLRSISPDLKFTDLAYYNPFDPNGSKIQIDGDIYRMIMGAAYLSLRSTGPIEVIEWFQEVAVKNHPLK